MQTAFAKYVIKVSNEIELKLKLVQMSGEDIKITPEEWTNENVTVTINTNKSGEVYYKINESGEWKKYEKNFEVEENCKIYAKIKYEDGESNEVEKEVTNIDKKKPIVKLVNPEDPITPDIQEYTILIGETATDIRKKLIAKDEGGSGLKTLSYAYSQSNTTEPTTYEEFKNEATVTKSATGGNWYIWTKVLDNAGNRAEETKVSPAYNVGYQISYDANGGTGAPKEQRKVHGTELKVSETIPTRTGYEFQGWATANTATTAELKAGENYTTDKAVKLYAVWKKYKYLNTTTSKYYMKLSDALNEVKDKETIKAMDYAIETTAPTLETAKAITFDLNGQTVVMSNVTLTNNGTLTIAGASGTLTGSGADTITNNGVLVKDTATEIASSATADYYVLRNDGTATISAGKLTSSYGGIYNGTNAKLNMIGGTLNSTYTAIRNYSTLSSESNPSVVIDGTSTSLTATGANVLNNQQTGLVYIKNGTLNMPTTTIATPTVINCRSGKVLISGGKIKMAGANAAVYNGYSGNSTADGTVEMTGGSIESTASFGIYSCEKTKLIVSGGSVLSSGGDAIMQIGSESASTTITGGTITSTKPGKSGLSICNGTVNITGGKIIGKAFGIWCHDTIKSTLTLGENDGKVSITTPEISGTEWGIYTGTATINFYDGILKGAIGQSIKGSNTIILTAPGYIVQKTTANSVETATLVPGGNQTVTYDLNETDMNNWLGLYKDRFTILYDSGTKLNEVTCKTDSGWEQLYIPIETVVGKTYTVEFDYQVPKAYDNLTTYTGAECQIVKTVIDNYKTDNVIAKEILPNTVQTTTKTASITFTATTTKVYFAINYGTTMDYRTVTLKFGNFKMKDTIEYNKKITTIPVIGNTNYMFDGWYTQKTGGTKVTEETVISTANPTYYAHWSEIQVGDTISYSPSGTYSWDKSYATSNETGTQTLNSASGQSFNVSKWKVLSIDKAKGKIEMVPETIPSGTVTLQGAQGYNNAVKLLNDACSSLYSDTSKGITARSITEEDFVKVGGTKWTNKRAAYVNYAKYGNQYGTPYTTNNYYPTMYKNEANNVINGTKTESGLKQSEQTNLIAKTDESSTNGYFKAKTSIQPYQTYYNTTNYATTASLLEGYANILLPKGCYWVASRCVNLNSSYCYFDVCFVNSGYFSASDLFYSGSGVFSYSRAVFPVVSLSSQLLEKTADGTYNVK